MDCWVGSRPVFALGTTSARGCIDGCDFEKKGWNSFGKTGFRTETHDHEKYFKGQVRYYLQDGFIRVSFVVITILQTSED